MSTTNYQSGKVGEDSIMNTDDGVSSFTTATSTTLRADMAYTVMKYLRVQSIGIRLIGIPMHPYELVINILNTDGSLAYASTRNSRCSGSCVLSSPDTGEVARTTYFWGPFRQPIVSLLPTGNKLAGETYGAGTSEGEEIKVISRGMLKGTAVFTSAKWGTFEWSYAWRKENNMRVNLLILEKRVPDENDSTQYKLFKIAELERSDETRTEGSTKHSAGNGGRLGVSWEASREIDESLIIASLLIMLKKEIDRRRMRQMATGSALY